MSTIASERKNQRLVARVSKSHKNVRTRSRHRRPPVATFVITHALEAAEQLVREQDMIRLSAEQSRRFVEARYAAPAGSRCARRAQNNTKRAWSIPVSSFNQRSTSCMAKNIRRSSKA